MVTKDKSTYNKAYYEKNKDKKVLANRIYRAKMREEKKEMDAMILVLAEYTKRKNERIRKAKLEKLIKLINRK